MASRPSGTAPEGCLGRPEIRLLIATGPRGGRRLWDETLRLPDRSTGRPRFARGAF